MKSAKFHAVALSMIIAALLWSLGCGGDAEVSNTAPSEVAIVGTSCFIEAGGTLALAASATDEDGDPLTYRWTATAGSFDPASATGASVQWTAPAAEGAATITLTVTDDIESVTKTFGLMVCTVFQGSVTTARTMSAGHTYMVKSTTLLPISGSGSLTIEPGVTVVFNQGGGFSVHGRLTAEGTAGQKIRFRGNTCESSVGAWSKIEIDGSSAEAIFRNAEISQSEDGVMFAEEGLGGVLTLENCTVYDNKNAGIGVMGQDATAHIRSSQVWENGTGIKISNGTADIRSSSVSYSAANGIWITYSLDDTHVTIDSTAVTSNGANGILLMNRASPTVHYCSIHSNGGDSGTGYAISLIAYYGVDPIDARHNFWGAGNTTSEKIGLVIFDGVDEPGLPYVDFSEFLTTSPAE